MPSSTLFASRPGLTEILWVRVNAYLWLITEGYPLRALINARGLPGAAEVPSAPADAIGRSSEA